MKNYPSSKLNRREAMAVLGMSAAGFVVACGGEAPATSEPAVAPAAPTPQTPTFPDGSIIRTILRDMSPDELANGETLFHEHMSLNNEFFEKLGAQGLFDPSRPHWMEDLELLIEEMRAAADDGVACIVDGGHTDMGRSVEFLRQLSDRSGMPIVVSGGYYTQCCFPPEIAEKDEDQLAEQLTQEANAERWGAFGEIGSSAEITPDERKVFRAVGKAHLRTALPIFSHTANGQEALEQLDILESVGVNAERVVIGHMGGLVDPEVPVHKAICERGAYVGFDRLGGPPESDAAQVPMILALIEAGYADRVLLASDFAQEDDLKSRGGPGYGKTVTQFVPMLRAAGADETTVEMITVENPLRWLAFVPRNI